MLQEFMSHGVMDNACSLTGHLMHLCDPRNTNGLIPTFAARLDTNPPNLPGDPESDTLHSLTSHQIQTPGNRSQRPKYISNNLLNPTAADVKTMHLSHADLRQRDSVRLDIIHRHSVVGVDNVAVRALRHVRVQREGEGDKFGADGVGGEADVYGDGYGVDFVGTVGWAVVY